MKRIKTEEITETGEASRTSTSTKKTQCYTYTCNSAPQHLPWNWSARNWPPYAAPVANQIKKCFWKWTLNLITAFALKKPRKEQCRELKPLNAPFIQGRMVPCKTMKQWEWQYLPWGQTESTILGSAKHYKHLAQRSSHLKPVPHPSVLLCIQPNLVATV